MQKKGSGKQSMMMTRTMTTVPSKGLIIEGKLEIRGFDKETRKGL
jgi:hypothetical protein